MKAFHSIKWRLLIWQAVLLAAVLATLMTLHYQAQKRDLTAKLDAELQETLMAVMPAIAPPQAAPRPDSKPRARITPRRPEWSTNEIQAELKSRGIYLLSAGPAGLQQYGDVPAALIRQTPRPVKQPVQRTRDGYRERIHSRPQMVMVIGKSLDEVTAKMATVLHKLIFIGIAVLISGFLVGWIIVTRSLRPIRAISRTAETIAGGEHHKRIELSDAPDELASLAQTLNESFDHLDEAIETQKRFTADASHELRTPVAVVITQAEAALKKERSAEEYKGVLEACLRAGRRMKTMAESLLELTRLDSRGAVLSKTTCDLNAVVAGAVDSGSLLSEKHPVRFQSLETGPAGLHVHMDKERIHQVITNLIANAVQHNPDGCEICVSLTKDGTIIISDNGIGISAEHLPHIFERFYRVDASRSREQGGAGLGLSIVQRLIEAHGGTITTVSKPGHGATFVITLPLA